MKRPSPKHTAKTTDWSGVADWYGELVGESGSEYHRHVVLPGVLKLLDAKPGQKVLDVACGEGVLCRLLAEKRIEAVGVDSAVPLLERARKLTKESQLSPPPAFYRDDARDLGFLPESGFDAAACVLAIQNVHPIGTLFAGVARALKPAGRFVLAMTHPCFRGAKETSWGWDEQNKVQYRRIDRYLVPRKTPIVTHPGRKDGSYTWTFHKPIEAYVKSLRSTGLLIDALEEWPSHKKSTSGPRAPAENVAREEIPMFLAIRAVKFSDTIQQK